jgi:four helix bundle protein
MKVQDLPAYRSAFNLASTIFEMSKQFPAEEIDAITNPIRRSSRRVCIHLSEAMSGRKYVKYFQTTLIDAGSANAETLSWLEFVKSCQYVDEESLVPIYDRCVEIGKKIQHMMDYPERFK